MKCPLCGYSFAEEEGAAACKGCPLARSCKKVRCPNCGYDVPLEPSEIKLFKAWRKGHGTGRKG